LQVDADPEVLVFGHHHAVQSVAWHPLKPHLFVSACEGQRVMLWSAELRHMVRSAKTAFPCTAVAISERAMTTSAADGTPGHHIAVGGAKGQILVLDEVTFAPLYSDTWAMSPIRQVGAPLQRHLGRVSY
jgi:hypothetical protein